MDAQAEEKPSTSGSSPYGSTEERCKLMLRRSLHANPTVNFLLDLMAQSGCSMKNSIYVAKCGLDASGGFIPDDGAIVLCHNHLGFQEEVDATLTHELVHAYDHCRASNLDWRNLQHHACSEIRAANLSGDCHLMKELLRGNFGLQAHHQVCESCRKSSAALDPMHVLYDAARFQLMQHVDEASAIEVCVKRRAQMSVAMHPDCNDKQAAKAAVEAAWPSCYKDLAPFDHVP